MSFDLAVLSGATPLEPDVAAAIYERLCSGEAWQTMLKPDPHVAEFVAEIARRWPQVDDVPPDEMDTCPWSVAFDTSPGHVLSAIQWSRAGDVAPFYVDCALRHGLYVFDPQERVLHSPGQSSRPVAQRTTTGSVVCAKCGKAIQPGEMSAEQAGRGVFHVGCLLGDWLPT